MAVAMKHDIIISESEKGNTYSNLCAEIHEQIIYRVKKKKLSQRIRRVGRGCDID